MFNRETVFVLGAGASCEYGFPLGLALRDEIRNFTNVQSDGFSPLGPCAPLIHFLARHNSSTLQAYFDAARRIHDGLLYFNSIDDFLDHRREDTILIELAKLAIAHIIMKKEAGSPLNSVNGRNRLANAGLHDTWAFKLTKMLVREVTRYEVSNVFRNVSFVSFNYDRSLEHFLSYAIAEACDTTFESAVSIVAKVPIHHVYGSLGSLPNFQPKSGPPFGAAIHEVSLLEISGGIRTYTESEADAKKSLAIRQLVAAADQIVFLGCGFHKQNIDILTPEHPLTDCEIIATNKGITVTGLETVSRRLSALFEGGNGGEFQSVREWRTIREGMHNMTCAQLFDEYALTLTE